MKKPFAVVFFLLLAHILSAQEVVATSGETKQISGYEISWTLGEPVIETFNSATNVLTQGFHQSKLIVTAIDEPGTLGYQLNVYPNPTSDYVIIDFNSALSNKQYSLFDNTGKRILLQHFSATKTQVDMSALASGTYLLQIGTKKTNRIQTFKIIKK